MSSNGRLAKPPPISKPRDKKRSVEYNDCPVKRFQKEYDDFDGIFTILQERIFVELKDHNIFRQPRPYNILEHMKDRSLLCIFHNDHGHTLATCKNLYNQIKIMMKKRGIAKIFEEEDSYGI